MRVIPEPSRRIITPTPNFVLDVTIAPRVINSSSSVELTVDDAVFSRQTTAEVQNDGIISLAGDISPGESTSTIQYESENELLTIQQNGTFTSHSSTGSASVLVKIPFATQRAVFPAGSLSQTADVFSRYANNTLGKLLFDDLNSLLNNYNLGSLVFASRNDAAGEYVRAVNFASLDLSGWSVWSSSHGIARSATAISLRHVLLARHFMPSSGATIRFVANDNTVIERTLIARQSVSGLDVAIGTLDSELPASIKIYNVLPHEWEYKITQMYSMPVIYTKTNLIYPRTWTKSDSMGAPTVYFPTVNSIRSVEWPGITQNVVSGDSGRPIFTIMDGVPILLASNWLLVNVEGAKAVSLNGAVVPLANAIMAPYTLDEYDLSAFENYYE